MGSAGFYVLTAALELPVILARYVAVYVVAAIALKATGSPSTDAGEWAKLAVLPTVFSAVALVSPAGGGWWWQKRMGGREPSTREFLAYRTAMEALRARTTILLPEPGRWFVMEHGERDAAVCGDALMLTRGLLESPELPAVLAHQLGHMRGMDARLTAALDRLVLNVWESPRANVEKKAAGAELKAAARGEGGAGRQNGRARTSGPGLVLVNRKLENAAVTWKLMRWAARMTVALLRGGVALRLTSIGWAGVWREAEYEADRFAAAIGWGEELASFLEEEAPHRDHPIPLVWCSDHTHPPTELRIDALRELAQPEQAGTTAEEVALGAEASEPEGGVSEAVGIEPEA